jgi:hypothetical protein
MATRIITKSLAALERSGAALPRWVWFVVLWGVGVGSALVVGELFKVLMNVTLFAVAR